MKHTPGFEAVVEDAKKRVREISVIEVVQKLSRKDDFIFVDVREESEWSAGRAVAAIHLGKGIIERDIETAIPDPSTEVILYCGGGYRSALAADAIQKMGYRNVYSMTGGMRAWREAGASEVR